MLYIRREFCKTRLTKKLIFVAGCEIGGPAGQVDGLLMNLVGLVAQLVRASCL